MSFPRGSKIKIVFYVGLIVATVLLYKNTAQTETQTGNINVNMNVVGSVTPPGGGEPSVSEPLIYDVVSSTAMTTARVVWKVNDFGFGLSTTSILYSTDFSFSNTAFAIVSGTEFIADISGLQPNTTYNFRIIAKNNSFVDAVPFQNQFRTKEGNILNLTLLAKPEKRVPKIGGNYSALARLIFFDAASNTVLMDTSTALSPTGSTTIYNVLVPEGTSLVAILKTNAHLAKRINGVNTMISDLILDFTENNTFYLLAGDMAGDLQNPTAQNPFTQFLQSVHQDEFVDILDISAVVSKFNDQTIGERSNLNGDNIVDAQDISIILGNWNKEGDIVVK